jgi:hypothetical protein
MKEDHLKTQCMKRHTALFDGDSHNMNSVGFSPNLWFNEETFLNNLISGFRRDVDEI